MTPTFRKTLYYIILYYLHPLLIFTLGRVLYYMIENWSLFRSFSSSIAVHGSGSIVIFVTGWFATRLAPPKSRDSNTSICTGQLYFTLGRAITLGRLLSLSATYFQGSAMVAAGEWRYEVGCSKHTSVSLERAALLIALISLLIQRLHKLYKPGL